MENLIKCIVTSSISKNKRLLCKSFQIADLINNERIARKKTEYGFEWIIHSIIAGYLIKYKERLQISEVKIGEKDSRKKKYDIFFKANRFQKEVIIEIKTVYQNKFSVAKSDLNKIIPNSAVLFLVIIAYPYSKAKIPNFSNALIIFDDIIIRNFRLYILKKN